MASIEYRGYNEKTNMHSYRVTISAGYDDKMKQSRIRRLIKVSGTEKARKKEVEKRAHALESKYKSHLITTAPRFTISEFSTHFLDNYVRISLKKKSVSEYERILKIISKYIGNFKLDDFSAYHLQQMYSQMRHDAVPLPTMDHYHGILSSLFNYAVKSQIVTINPCKLVDRPRLSKTKKVENKKRMHFLNPEQITIMIEFLSVEPIRYYLAIMIALFAGLRKSEINGLRWSDFDFNVGKISVQRQINYTSKFGIFEDTPKTDSSVRVIFPPQYIFDIMKEYRVDWEKQQIIVPDERKTDYLFIQEQGGVIHPDTIAGWFRKFLKKVRLEQQKLVDDKKLDEQLILPYIRFHDLRHSCGSLRCALGENIDDVGAYLGHSDRSSTEIYVHALNLQQKTISEKMTGLTQPENNQIN